MNVDRAAVVDVMVLLVRESGPPADCSGSIASMPRALSLVTTEKVRLLPSNAILRVRPSMVTLIVWPAAFWLSSAISAASAADGRPADPRRGR